MVPDGSPRISRRRVLQVGMAAPAALLAACAEPSLSPSALPTRTATAEPIDTAVATPTARPTGTREPTPETTPGAGGRRLYRAAALADGRSASLQRGMSILVDNHRIRWIRPVDGEEDASGARVIDAAGATFVPGLVDSPAT